MLSLSHTLTLSRLGEFPKHAFLQSGTTPLQGASADLGDEQRAWCFGGVD